MATKRRDYRADVPYHLVVRLRSSALRSLRMRRFYTKILVIQATRCDVDILAYYITGTHVHLIVSQRFSGQHPTNRRGISAFMRNANMQLAKRINRQKVIELGKPAWGKAPRMGHALIETYTAHELETPYKLLHALNYVHAQGHHHPKAPQRSDPFTSSWAVYAKGVRDGVVTVRLDLPGIELTPILERGAELGAQLERDPALPFPWYRACDSLIEEHPALDPFMIKDEAFVRTPWVDSDKQATICRMPVTWASSS